MDTLNVDRLLEELSLPEKIQLTSGKDFWHTTPIKRLDIPSLRLSDGPNGVRGTRFVKSIPSACIPCATGLAATWDGQLLKAVGGFLGLEAKAKGAHVVLGPTTNTLRSPLGGRGFESFSEDPLLSGLLAAAYINGLQEEGIVATLKHFVCNDLEDQRRAVDIIVSERALREIYLMPFMLAIRDAHPGAIMTAYNKVNGIHCSENRKLLQDVLRGEWGWKGLVLSDWFGTYSTVEALDAGLDLEMPGPTQWRNITVMNSFTANKLSEETINDRARNVLNLIKLTKASGIPENGEESSRDVEEDKVMLRRLAAESIVLMKNESSILPLKRDRTTAVIGPNAGTAIYCGGGSAALTPSYTISPLDGIRSKCDKVTYAHGVYSHQELPLLNNVYNTIGNRGLTFRAYNDPPEVTSRECIEELHVTSSNFFLTDFENPKLDPNLFYAEIEAYLTPEESGIWDFGVSASGTAKLFVDGEEIIDNETKQVQGHAFFGSGTREEVGQVTLSAGKKHKLLVTFGSGATSKLLPKGVVSFRKGGVRLGGCPTISFAEATEAAVEVAAAAEQVLIVAGLNGDWETEGHDRENMDLPPGTNTLISKVLEVAPDAIVVIQSGTPVEMPWVGNCKALLQAWYGGNETGNGIADILFGDVNPSAKLPITFPVRVQDNPAYINSKSDTGRMLYGENIYVGYRYYEKVGLPALFPFGHGLSYTVFDQKDLSIALDKTFTSLTITVTIHNTGMVAGAEVTQVYISQRNPSISRPPRELKAFEKTSLEPGEEKVVNIDALVKYATSFWNEARGKWQSDQGIYDVLVGNSSNGPFLTGSFELRKTTLWTGL